MNLLFDEMLGNLARWCRILGIDSSFYTGKSDSQLFQIAKAEDRTLVTRDLKLAERCGKGGVRFILVKGERIEEQTAQVLKESGAAVTFPEKTRRALGGAQRKRGGGGRNGHFRASRAVLAVFCVQKGILGRGTLEEYPEDIRQSQGAGLMRA
jgi:predicted nuclease of predicted toxin-antitoxin system